MNKSCQYVQSQMLARPANYDNVSALWSDEVKVMEDDTIEK